MLNTGFNGKKIRNHVLFWSDYIFFVILLPSRISMGLLEFEIRSWQFFLTQILDKLQVNQRQVREINWQIQVKNFKNLRPTWCETINSSLSMNFFWNCNYHQSEILIKYISDHFIYSRLQIQSYELNILIHPKHF